MLDFSNLNIEHIRGKVDTTWSGRRTSHRNDGLLNEIQGGELNEYFALFPICILQINVKDYFFSFTQPYVLVSY